jgi:hypothetical protein
VKTLPSCIGAWRNIWTKITINHLCAPPPPNSRLFQSPRWGKILTWKF